MGSKFKILSPKQAQVFMRRDFFICKEMQLKSMSDFPSELHICSTWVLTLFSELSFRSYRAYDTVK